LASRPNIHRFRWRFNAPSITFCKDAPVPHGAWFEFVWEIEMTGMTSYDADLRAVAHAYIDQCEIGARDYTAFAAAVGAYRKRHPETTNGEAAFIVSNLMREMPRASCR
jgi:hypothetical protein